VKATTPTPTTTPAAGPNGQARPTNAGATPVSSKPAVAAEVSPEQCIRDFYAYLNAQDFQAAWHLMSAHYQASLDFAAWVAGYSTTQSIELTSVSLSDQHGAYATANIAIRATDKTDAGVRTTDYQGTWDLILADGAWKLDRATVRQQPD
jgi:hypothetical protein